MATENSMASDFRLKELRSAPRGEPRIDRVLRMVFLVSSHAEIVPEILMLRSGSQLVQLPNVPPDPNPTDPIASVPTIIRPLLLTTTLLSWFFNVRLARCGRFAITTAAACEVPPSTSSMLAVEGGLGSTRPRPSATSKTRNRCRGQFGAVRHCA